MAILLLGLSILNEIKNSKSRVSNNAKSAEKSVPVRNYYWYYFDIELIRGGSQSGYQSVPLLVSHGNSKREAQLCKRYLRPKTRPAQ